MNAVLSTAGQLLFGREGLLARHGLALVLSAYEVAGPSVFDLLAARAKLRAREDQGGQVFVDAAGVEVGEAAQLAALLQAAGRARRTTATARNPGSSRWAGVGAVVGRRCSCCVPACDASDPHLPLWTPR